MPTKTKKRSKSKSKPKRVKKLPKDATPGTVVRRDVTLPDGSKDPRYFEATKYRLWKPVKNPDK